MRYGESTALAQKWPTNAEEKNRDEAERKKGAGTIVLKAPDRILGGRVRGRGLGEAKVLIKRWAKEVGFTQQ